jgi:zeaxanthin glucosyltransferase
MLSVGGLGTIKECMWLGVPMVLLPSREGYDPPGNAARAAHHGIARVLDPERADAEALGRAVDAGLAGEHRAAIERMRLAFVAAEAEGSMKGLALVERALAGRA